MNVRVKLECLDPGGSIQLTTCCVDQPDEAGGKAREGTSRADVAASTLALD